MTPLRLTRRQSREIDRIAIEEYGLAGVVLMENAARSIVDAIIDLLAADPGEIVVACGPGDNGGDGLAVARHLRILGRAVSVVLAAPPEAFRGDAATNLQILRRSDGYCAYADPAESDEGVRVLAAASLVVDALFGTGLSRPPEGDVAELIDTCNTIVSTSTTPLVAVDLPSGLDCDTGRPLGSHCIRATRTITMATEKIGFADPASRAWTGEVRTANIGVPLEIIARAAALPA